MKQKILFVCNYNQIRSKTAEDIFKGKYDTKSCGIIYNKINQDLIDWSDFIIVMEDFMIDYIINRFDVSSNKLISLNIPSKGYMYMQDDLIFLIKERFNQYFKT